MEDDRSGIRPERQSGTLPVRVVGATDSAASSATALRTTTEGDVVLADERYRIRIPVRGLRVEHDDGVDIVSDTFSTVYGVGESPAAAIDDYVRSLFDYFAKLEEREVHLARGLRRELEILRRYIVPQR